MTISQSSFYIKVQYQETQKWSIVVRESHATNNAALIKLTDSTLTYTLLETKSRRTTFDSSWPQYYKDSREP